MAYIGRTSDDEPTDLELANFIESWLEQKKADMGFEFIAEAIGNNTTLWEKAMLDTHGHAFNFGYVVQEAIDAYYRPLALLASQEHDFERDRREKAIESQKYNRGCEDD